MSSVTISAVGDIMLDRRLQPPRVFYHYPEVSSCVIGLESNYKIPFINSSESHQWLASLDRSTQGIHATSHAATSLPVELPKAVENDANYVFRAMADELRGSDMVFGNLECPLSRRGRPASNDINYQASPNHAQAMATAGFRVLSFANNHALDYGELAFHDTLEALRESGIAIVGAGVCLEDARSPAVISIGSETIGFLGYSMVGPDWIYASTRDCGVAPLNPLVVGQDISRIRASVDVLVLSIHWGLENRATPWPRLVELARDFVDCGADVILGHHPHVPGSIEIYRQRPIFYSLGNFIFGHDHSYWGDNMLVKLKIANHHVRSVEIVPVRGRYQPAILYGHDADALLEHLIAISRSFGTVIRNSSGRGVIQTAA